MSDVGQQLGVGTQSKVQDVPLTIRDHLDPDKHWIGETLGVPTQTEIAATVGNVSGPGDSPFVARADHIHKLGAGVVTDANLTPTIRFRFARGPNSIPVGDQQFGGAYTNFENVGGFTGTGHTSNPLVVPSPGSYMISTFYFGQNWGDATKLPSASIIDARGTSFFMPLFSGTGLYSANTMTIFLAAGSTIEFRIRNNSGATAPTVSLSAEVCKVHGS